MTAGRKSIDSVAQDKPVIDTVVVSGELATQTMAITRQDATVRAVAERMGYQLPADCTDPDLIQRDIAANMRRSAEAMLQVGIGLICLKEACEHGEFMARLEVLRFEPSVARRYMAVARKLSNRATSHDLIKVADSQSKLIELICLDDDQLEELELTGQTGELALDDIATMGVRELRERIRKERREREEAKAAAVEINRRKDQRINSLEEENATLTAKPKPEPTPELIGEERLRFISEATMKTVADIEAGLRSHFTLLENLYPAGDIPNHARLAQQQALSQIIQAARSLAGDFGITLQTADLERPENLWLTQAKEIFGDVPMTSEQLGQTSIPSDLVDTDLVDTPDSEA